jgi:glycosyltransferase involved in cell wall biosynthesis
LPFAYEAVYLPRPDRDVSTLATHRKIISAVKSYKPRLQEADLVLELFGEPSDLKIWTTLFAGKAVRPTGFIIGSRTFEDHARPGWKKNVRNRIYRKWMQSAAGIAADGQDIVKELERHGIDPGTVTVLYASIDTGMYHPEASKEAFLQFLPEWFRADDGKPLLLFCGRLHPMNRPMDFLAVLKAIPEARGVMIGDGPLRVEVDRELEALGGRAVCLGYQPESVLPAAFCAADVCLFPLSNMTAGISLVVPKAMACGATVVTNGVTDIGRLVRDGESGVLCREGDVWQWVRVVKELLEQPERRKQLGDGAVATIRESWSEASRRAEVDRWLRGLAG